MNGKLILITGASTGLGRALAETALTQGYRVVGTMRSDAAREEFEALAPGQAFSQLLDVTDTATIPAIIADVEKTVGPIDVLVNNAGYGLEAPIEESPLAEVRRQFDVNFFGAVAVTQAVLPYMRQRRAGHILNVTSMGGLVTFPGVGVYSASKFALEGLSEALRQEVNQFGISVTAIEPGMFRTDWAGRSMTRLPRTIADYDASFDQQREARKQRNGKQLGDPVKAAKAMLQIMELSNPPAHLLLGPDAVKVVAEKLESHLHEIEEWRELSSSTNF